MTVLLQTKGIKKRYGSVEALRGVDFSIRRGETVGAARRQRRRQEHFREDPVRGRAPDGSAITYGGKPVEISHPDQARSLGIETVYQDLGLCDNLTVSANMFLGRERDRPLRLPLQEGRWPRRPRRR